ncbi:leucyl/phenylalanyl-tRNA--protein transferase [Flexivirga sp. ID2601S]|uniref:Leucyl/phenylalanyl-tRNA--protein transferase n=1 Tax=Flexivirga aerilata TaxID=1656889 RepID=A0A849AN89_9MICO|nr:leucyl/phenylalanyl-tRNA--protein transferase [Flexivirga aerilata]NNG39810.1 leucyl/phenylalanyl-tRNA--protein transferase [Flexivirga aerilata]
MPVEPPPTEWNLGDQDQHLPQDLIAVGADLAPGTLLAAYRSGLFPMGIGDDGRPPIGWWSPVRRGVLLPGDHRVPRSLRRSRRRFRVSTDEAFDEVVAGCADPGRDGRWITRDVARAYARLHDLGWAHSIEVWDEGEGTGETGETRGTGELVGGLYGVCTGGLFAGESMFHRATDASKVALWALVELFFADGDPRRLIDVQWQTDHLRTLGVREIGRRDYLQRLSAAQPLAIPPVWRDEPARGVGPAPA